MNLCPKCIDEIHKAEMWFDPSGKALPHLAIKSHIIVFESECEFYLHKEVNELRKQLANR